MTGQEIASISQMGSLYKDLLRKQEIGLSISGYCSISSIGNHKYCKYGSRPMLRNVLMRWLQHLTNGTSVALPDYRSDLFPCTFNVMFNFSLINLVHYIPIRDLTLYTPPWQIMKFTTRFCQTATKLHPRPRTRPILTKVYTTHSTSLWYRASIIFNFIGRAVKIDQRKGHAPDLTDRKLVLRINKASTRGW